VAPWWSTYLACARSQVPFLAPHKEQKKRKKGKEGREREGKGKEKGREGKSKAEYFI
jgi:hypothetical protein